MNILAEIKFNVSWCVIKAETKLSHAIKLSYASNFEGNKKDGLNFLYIMSNECNNIGMHSLAYFE